MNTDSTDLTAIRQRAKRKATDANGDPSRPGWTEAILARLEAAASGPWAVAYGNDPNHIAVKEYSIYEVGRYIAVLDQNEGDREADAAFIAHARTDIPYLLDRIDALEQALAAARTALSALEPESLCRWCLTWTRPDQEQQHAPDCKRQQALTEIAGVIGAEPCIEHRWVTRIGQNGILAPDWKGWEEVFCLSCGTKADA